MYLLLSYDLIKNTENLTHFTIETWNLVFPLALIEVFLWSLCFVDALLLTKLIVLWGKTANMTVSVYAYVMFVDASFVDAKGVMKL